MAAEVGAAVHRIELVQHVMHVAARTVPAAVGRLVRQRRHVAEVGMRLRQRVELVVVVQLAAVARTLHQRDRQRFAGGKQVEDHRARAGQA
ncbi:hypothetical protein D9M68_684730 [compost metagenome]